MGRRSRSQRTSGFEDLIILASRFPWWGCLLLGLLSFVILHAIASRPIMPKTVTPGQMGDAVVSGMVATLAILGQIIFPFAFVFAAILSGVNGYRKRQDGISGPSHLDSAPSPRTRVSTELPALTPYGTSSHTTTPNFQHELSGGFTDSVAKPSHTESLPQQWGESVLQMIEWKRFEIVTKEFLNMTGFDAQETKVGADGGVDIRVTKRGNDTFQGIVQCKAWNAYKVGVKPVRELYGIMAAEKISNGMLITSGTFTADAEEFAKGKVTLIPGWKLLELIRKLPEEKRQRLLEVALEGDYQTPTCPQCDIKMTLRESKKGRSTGGLFWGCVRYPRCKQTLIYKAE